MCETCGCSTQGSPRIVEVQQALLKKNEAQAARNREHIERLGACGINLISAPGSGKTTLLEQTIDALGRSMRIGVIEGDLETERDAERIAPGAPVLCSSPLAGPAIWMPRWCIAVCTVSRTRQTVRALIWCVLKTWATWSVPLPLTWVNTGGWCWPRPGRDRE